MRTSALFSLALSIACLASAGARCQDDLPAAISHVTATGAYATDERLSSPEYSGRLTGTEGFTKAARWMAGEAKRAGLSALSEAPDYLLPFPIILGGIESSSMELLPADDKGTAQKLEMFKDYLPILQSASGEVTAEIVFAGFGITASDLGRDDYAGLDVKGKIVMVIRGEPKDGRDWRKHDDSRARYANARAHGAAACLMADQAVASPNGEPLPGMAMGEVSTEMANTLLASKGLKTDDLRKVLEAGGMASFPTGRTLHFSVKAREAHQTNGYDVMSELAGSDPKLRSEYVLVGAHLDHCGDWPSLLPGADDNGSGSSTLLEIARAAGSLKPRPKRTIVFVWFGGEEMGLLGSKFLSEHMPGSLGKCVAVLNMDMVGAGNGAWVAGGKNYPEVFKSLEDSRDKFAPGVKLEAGESKGEARADHGPFQAIGLHAVSLFGSGGSHHGYHTPDDTIFFITPKTMEAVGRIVLGAAVELADEPQQPL